MMHPIDPSEHYRFSDFTQAEYRKLLRFARDRFSFARFGERPDCPHLLWRHDLDASVHRAHRLAEIEAEEKVRSTFLVMLRCAAYNPFSAPVAKLLREIVRLGHDVGLHFDSTFPDASSIQKDMEARISAEKLLLADICGVEPRVLSFHLYGNLAGLPEDDVVAGMINAYSATLKRDYQYVSDSNGIWRYRSIRTVLEDPNVRQLQVLTHPEWWSVEAKSPRSRLEEVLTDYSRACGEEYDAIVAASGRDNVR